MNRKRNVQISVQYFSIKWENHKGGGGGDNQDKCVWFVNVFLGLKVLMFFKSLCRVFLMMVIRAWWTGPLPSCRFKGEAAGCHPPPKPHSCLFFFFCFLLFFGLFCFFLSLISVANLSSRWVECVRWSSSQLIKLLCKPCSLHTMLKALSAGERFFWQAPKVISVNGEAIWV